MLGEARQAGTFAVLKIAILVFNKLLAQPGVNFGKAVKNLVAQRCVQASVGGADSVFDAGLVFRLVRIRSKSNG
jgi:hypothetical protein